MIKYKITQYRLFLSNNEKNEIYKVYWMEVYVNETYF